MADGVSVPLDTLSPMATTTMTTNGSTTDESTATGSTATALTLTGSTATESANTPSEQTASATQILHDPQDPFPDLVMGYPKLAGRMGALPEIAMFRRFGALNARNLLYMQNELYSLEEELKMIEAADSKSDVGNKKMYSRDSSWLSPDIVPHLQDGDYRQRDLVLRIRQLLREYSMYSRDVDVG